MKIKSLLTLAATALFAADANAATASWSGTTDSAWNASANWGGTALDANPTSNALTFNGTFSNQPSNNDLTNLIISSLTFGSTLGQAVNLGGNSFTLTGGLTNLNTTASRNVTIGNNINVSGDQTWTFANDLDAVTILSGNLTGSGNITTSATNTTPAIRLTGADNSGYTGTINTATGGILLGSAGAMTGGLINLNNGDRRLTITGGAGSGNYTFGIGGQQTTGARVDFRSTGSGGLYLTGGNATWNPGGGTDYDWSLSGTGVGTIIGIAGGDVAGRVLNFGNSSGNLTVSVADKTIRGGTNTNPVAVNLLYALGGTDGKTLISQVTNLVLTRDSVAGNNLNLTISRGNGGVNPGLEVASMSYLPNGTLTFGGSGTAVGANVTFKYTGADNTTSNRAFVIGDTSNAAKNNLIIDTANALALAGHTGTASNGGLTKTGLGTLILSGANTYTGNTTVSAGTLLVTGSLASGSAVTVATGGTLGGNGTIGGATTIQSGGTLAPGNSPGTLTFTNTLSLNGTTTMEIDGNSGAGVTGGHDFVNLTGAGALGVLTTGGSLTLDIGTTFGTGTYSWNLFDFASETGTFSSVSLADQYTGSLTNTSGVWDLTSGDNTWQFTEATGVLGLTVAIPEPATWALLAGSLTTVMVLRRRRRA